MSFGSFNLFNFYQQPNTGIFPTAPLTTLQIATVQGGNEASGTVADFNWYFPYASSDVEGRIPPAIFEGGGTPIHLLSDSELGLHYGVVVSSVSGNILGNADTTSMVFTFSGNAEPVITGYQSHVVIFSGDTKGSLINFQNILTTTSGNFLNFDSDQSNIYTLISGNIYQDVNLNFVYLSYSGNIISGKIDVTSINLHLSGNCYPVNGDNYNLNYGLVQYTSTTGGQYISGIYETFVDVGNLTYAILGYSKGNN